MSILVKLFDHNRWANLSTVAACAALTDEQLDATASGTAGTIRETLMHITGAEQRYVWRLSTTPTAYEEHAGWPGVDELGRFLAQSGAALIDLAEHANADTILTTVDSEGQPAQFPAVTVYVQAINHATEHRSQIATILTQLGIEPPDVSGWAWGRR